MQENIIWDLLDRDCITKYLSKNLTGVVEAFNKIEVESVEPIKKQIWLTTYHVVIQYKLNISFVNGDTIGKIIYVTAHDHEPRQQVHEILQYFHMHGFTSGKLLVPKPLFYDKKYNATFYEGVIGENLYYYIKKNNRPVIEEMINQSAQWFAKLHKLKASVSVFTANQNAYIETMAPGVAAVLSSIKHKYPEIADTYERLYRHFIDKESQYFKTHKRREIIHGDAHPENVIRVAANKIALIDFVDMSLGDRARDVGCFLQQLDYMATRKIGDLAYVEKIKELFLTSYLKHAKIKGGQSFMKRVDLYYQFTAIRTATFFLIKHDPQPERAWPLIESVREKLKI